MRRVTGIGGIFFTAKDPVALRAWYQRHLGIDVQVWGGAAFNWGDDNDKAHGGMTIWSINPCDAANFAPGKANFMINYRVEDVFGLIKLLREEGCQVLDQTEDGEYGKFAWVIDPEGNKVELWQAP